MPFCMPQKRLTQILTEEKGELTVYCILKILNNNALLARETDDGSERILLGKGIGFGKRAGDEAEVNEGVQVYTPVVREEQRSTIHAVNAIDPVYIEAAGKIIEEAEKVFDSMNGDILLPLADHLAFAARRERENIFLSNPFIPDIKILFGKEYAVALESRKIIEQMTGYRISDDEAGFIALHIHSGLSDEAVSETLKATQIIDESMQIIEEHLPKEMKKESLSYIRLMSHLYYMVARAKAKEAVNVDLNAFVQEKYPKAMAVADLVCRNMKEKLGIAVMEEEIGFLAIHIQRMNA